MPLEGADLLALLGVPDPDVGLAPGGRDDHLALGVDGHAVEPASTGLDHAPGLAGLAVADHDVADRLAADVVVLGRGDRRAVGREGDPPDRLAGRDVEPLGEGGEVPDPEEPLVPGDQGPAVGGDRQAPGRGRAARRRGPSGPAPATDGERRRPGATRRAVTIALPSRRIVRTGSFEDRSGRSGSSRSRTSSPPGPGDDQVVAVAPDRDPGGVDLDQEGPPAGLDPERVAPRPAAPASSRVRARAKPARRAARDLDRSLEDRCAWLRGRSSGPAAPRGRRLARS